MIWPSLEYWWLIPTALILDLALGDPKLPWRHPVCWIGGLIEQLESVARRCGGGRAAGALAVAAAVGLVGYVVFAPISLPGLIGMLFALYLSWAGLALGGLLRAGERTLRVFENGSLPDAQEALSMLVSRDTTVQDFPTLRKSLADTLSENLTDAVIAPLFWLAVGGPVGLWCYKTVSTFDSMWGYKTERWRRLGWAGARLDDVLAYVPARLSVIFLRLADLVFRVAARHDGRWPGFRTVAAQARGMASPNAGWPMTAAAWLLGGRMGGPTVYFGELVDKPWVGPPAAEARPWEAARLRALCGLIRQASLLGAGVIYIVWLGCTILWWARTLLPSHLPYIQAL